MTEHKYVRSERNPGAIINTDQLALEAYRSKKKIAERNREVADKVEQLEAKVDRIEDVLRKILEKLG